MVQRTQPVVIGPVFGNSGETDGELTLFAITEPSPHWPLSGRIYLASTRETPFVVDLAMSPDIAMQLAAQLVALANAAVAACPQATAHPEKWPATLTDVDEPKQPIVRVQIATANDPDQLEQLRVFVDDKLVTLGDYGGEPEDNIESRDYSWVKGAVRDVAAALGATVVGERVDYETHAAFYESTNTTHPSYVGKEKS